MKLVVQAYNSAIADKAILTSFDENDITSVLHDYMDSSPQRSRFSISTNVESHIPTKGKKKKGFAAKYPRIDLRFVTFNLQAEVKYFMEGKNLKESSSSLKRRYITTGIDSFINRKYPEGFLVGYFLEGDLNKCVVGVNRLLTGDTRESEVLNKRESLIHSEYYESIHSGETVKHFMLDFT